MWIICDATNVVQDISSIEANLSRGYKFLNYNKHEISLRDWHKIKITIGDVFDGKNVIKNNDLIASHKLKALERSIIEASIRADKAQALGFTDLKIEYDTEKTLLETKKSSLKVDKIK